MPLGGFPVVGLSALVGAKPPLAPAPPLIQFLAAGFALATLLDLNDTPVNNQRTAGLIVFRLPGRHESDLLAG
jgi:hypothetical protein